MLGTFCGDFGAEAAADSDDDRLRKADLYTFELRRLDKCADESEAPYISKGAAAAGANREAIRRANIILVVSGYCFIPSLGYLVGWG